MSDYSFVHLRVHSAYSLLEGAIMLKKLPSLCQKANMPALGLTDTNNLFGALEFSEIMASQGIQPIIGLQIDVDITSYFTDLKQKKNILAPILLYAKNANGYQNLLKIASRSYTLHSLEEGVPFTMLEDLKTWNEDIICLTGGQNGVIGTLLTAQKFPEAEKLILRLKEVFGDRLYIELQRIGLDNEKDYEKIFLHFAYKHHIPLVATNDVMFATPDMYNAHDALICIAAGAYVSDDNRRKISPEQWFKSSEQMVALFHDLPEAIENTVEISKRCAFKVEKHPPILPIFVQSEDSDAEGEELKRQARLGLEERLSQNKLFASREIYGERLEFELDVICKMKFPGYFLIVGDFIRWAKTHNIPVGPGRGSGAGSVVAWSLTITDLDPLRFGLLFERFLNPERVSMPDFDIDFCQERREEVIKYVQERYGRDKVAQIITFGKLQARAVMRDVGRVLQMPYGQVDRLCKMIPNNPAHPMTIEEALENEEALATAKRTDENVSLMLDMAMQLEGLYRHASTHAAGVVIGDRPLDELVPLYRDPRSDMPVTQFNMKWVEPAGLVKFDFLGLKTLTVIQKTVELLKNRDIVIDPVHIPLDDVKTFELLGKGESTGVFQLESAGMRDVLRKMKPDCIEDIIALVALYRPGPMDNIPQYISVKKGEKKPDYLHPSLEETLKETYGVIIYQEQVMQIAQILSGYSLGEADLLRRAMGKKIKAEMDEQKLRFIEGAIAKGVDEKQAGGIFDLVAKFAGYGFNKSHAAAYAIISYQTAYFKANYPVEFMAATMTFEMSNTDKLVISKQEVDRSKLILIPPCVNLSGIDFVVKNQKIHYALSAIKNVGVSAMTHLVREREANGLYKDIYDFARRLDTTVINKRTLEFLAKSGAFDCFNGNRRQIIESLDVLVAESTHATFEKTGGQNSLFGDVAQSEQRMPLANVPDYPTLERLSHEHAALGFYLSAHPLDDFASTLKRAGIITYAELCERATRGSFSASLAGTVSSRQERKSAKGNRYAFVQLSDSSGTYEVTVFSETLTLSRDLLEAGKSVVLSVEVDSETEQLRLRVNNVKDLVDIPQMGDVNLRMTISTIDVVASLKKLLVKKGTGNVQLLVQDFGKNQEFVIRLPEKYLLTPAVQTSLQSLSGISKIEEF